MVDLSTRQAKHGRTTFLIIFSTAQASKQLAGNTAFSLEQSQRPKNPGKIVLSFVCLQKKYPRLCQYGIRLSLGSPQDSNAESHVKEIGRIIKGTGKETGEGEQMKGKKHK